ncbi:MAG: hypothetical protein LBJ71_04605 [Holosporaceae bacterium]|jgi:hypothetical protein|nr:hypothetical protein [Holosporaceae bacterium]
MNIKTLAVIIGALELSSSFVCQNEIQCMHPKPVFTERMSVEAVLDRVLKALTNLNANVLLNINRINARNVSRFVPENRRNLLNHFRDRHVFITDHLDAAPMDASSIGVANKENDTVINRILELRDIVVADWRANILARVAVDEREDRTYRITIWFNIETVNRLQGLPAAQRDFEGDAPRPFHKNNRKCKGSVI